MRSMKKAGQGIGNCICLDGAMRKGFSKEVSTYGLKTVKKVKEMFEEECGDRQSKKFRGHRWV